MINLKQISLLFKERVILTRFIFQSCYFSKCIFLCEKLSRVIVYEYLSLWGRMTLMNFQSKQTFPTDTYAQSLTNLQIICITPILNVSMYVNYKIN